jgi:hypothetical protein
MAWKDKKIVNLEIHSSLGGNLRIMSDYLFKPKAKTQPASDKNPNLFFAPATETAAQMTGKFVYDLSTESGKIYVIK